jgi:hypothetical protein
MPAFLLPLAAGAATAAAPAAASLTPSLIAGGASLAGSFINAGSQLGTNSSQLSYSKEMYAKQRADALADWNMQNLYNSPKQQMARFKEAGLNPNLIYGQMANAPVVRTSSPQSYNPTAPQIDLGTSANLAIGQYYDTQLKSAQIDLVKAQADATLQDALIKVATNDKLRQELPFVTQNADAALSGQLLKNRQQDYYNQNLQPQEYQKNDATIRNIIASTRLNTEQKIKVSEEIKNVIKTGDLLDFEKKLKEFQVDNQQIMMISGLLGKFLGLIPGIGSLFKK